jgi:uncharacterized metal-binding protein YceD (DUF177 family)
MNQSADSSLAPFPLSLPLRVTTLSSRKPNRFDLKPNAATRATIADFLGILSIKEMRFKGDVSPAGRHDFALTAELTAVVEQECSVTLVPVKTQITENVSRRFIADMQMPDAEEAEIPEDDNAEPLAEFIDPGHVAVEALSLALPAYPRAPGVKLDEASFAPPGATPLQDADLKPFAGLADLKAKLEAKVDEATTDIKDGQN